MAISQLTKGRTVPAPNQGPLRVSLSAPAGVELTLNDENGRALAPDGRVSASEVFVSPRGVEVLVGARSSTGVPFEPGVMIGVTIRHPVPDRGDEVVRVPVDAGGRSGIALVRISGTPPLLKLTDAFVRALPSAGAPGVGGITASSDLWPRPAKQVAMREWHRPGAYAYHAHHDGVGTEDGAWSLVVDGSASLLTPARRPALGTFLELLHGITAAARGGGPEGVLLCGAGSPTDVSAATDQEQPDWFRVLGDTPSPWSRVTPAVVRAAEIVGGRGLVVLVVDGVPVDVDELIDWCDATSDVTLHVVALGRSPYEARADRRPTHWWDHSLLALEGVTDSGVHHLVSVDHLAAAPQHGVELADALHRGVASAALR